MNVSFRHCTRSNDYCHTAVLPNTISFLVTSVTMDAVYVIFVAFYLCCRRNQRRQWHGPLILPENHLSINLILNKILITANCINQSWMLWRAISNSIWFSYDGASCDCRKSVSRQRVKLSPKPVAGRCNVENWSLNEIVNMSKEYATDPMCIQ